MGISRAYSWGKERWKTRLTRYWRGIHQNDVVLSVYLVTDSPMAGLYNDLSHLYNRTRVDNGKNISMNQVTVTAKIKRTTAYVS
jgi:hypothetical protein